MWINKNHADYWAHCPTEHKEEGVHGVYRTLEVRHMSHCRRGQYVWVPYYSDREPRKEWDDTLGGGVKKKRVLIWLLIMCKVRKKQRLGKRKWSFQGRVCTKNGRCWKTLNTELRSVPYSLDMQSINTWSSEWPLRIPEMIILMNDWWTLAAEHFRTRQICPLKWLQLGLCKIKMVNSW